MKKIHIIFLIAAGLASFASSFAVSWFLKKDSPAPTDAKAAAQTPAASAALPAALAVAKTDDDLESGSLSEKQLKHLIADIREKMKDYQDRQKDLDIQSKQIEMTKQTLTEDIERLNLLRNKLDITLAALSEQQNSLNKTVIEIQSIEKNNLQRIAVTYDKMDPAQAGKILVAMASGSQLQDAVKILYYMSERTAGKLLGEIGSTRPELASAMCLHLKHIKEGQ